MISIFSEKSELLGLGLIAVILAILARVRFDLWVAVAMAFSTALIPVYRKASELMREKRKRRNRKKKLREIVSSASANLHELKIRPSEKKDKDEIIDRLEDENITKKKGTIFLKVVDWTFPEASETEKRITVLLINSLEIDNSSSLEEQRNLRDINEAVIDNFNLGNPDKAERRLVKGFEEMKSPPEEYRNIEEAFIGDISDEITPKLLQISKEWCNGNEFAYSVFQDKKKVEEFQETLSELFSRGKLRLRGVESDVEDLKQEMEDKSNKRKFMVFVQGYHKKDEFESRLESFPHLKFGRKYPSEEFPDSIKYTRMYIVDPELEYRSADDFYHSELEPVVSKDKEGFVAVMPLEFNEQKIKPEDIEENFSEAFEYLKTGSNIDRKKIISEKITSEVKISELMASIPFNVLVPEIKESEKDLIIENYTELKDEFNIDELFDWANRNSDELADKLISLDKKNTSDRERWEELSAKIINEANECSRATFEY